MVVDERHIARREWARLAGSSLLDVLIIAFILLISSGDLSAQVPSIPFEARWGASLTDADKASVLHLAQTLSNRPVRKVVVTPALPTSIPIVTVLYSQDVIDTCVVETTLEIHKRDRAYWNQTHLDSLNITDGDWGTKQDFLRRRVLWRFRLDATEATLPVDDSVSYREVRNLLEAIRNKAVVWDDNRFPQLDFTPADIQRIARSQTPGRYHIGLAIPGSPALYGLGVVFDGKTIRVKQASMAIP